jgi:GNAT superfamily N-acetyltransferase
MPDDYEFRKFDLSAAELEAVSEMLRGIFRHAPYLTPRYLKWQYADNPDGPAVGCNAWHKGKVVGHLASLPIRAIVEGAERKGVFFLNTAVEPAHWGHKIAKLNGDRVFEEAANRGYEFCLAVGNSYSTGPLLTRFQMVKPLDARIGFGLPRRGGPSAEPSFARLWSEEAMRWRLANPERPYSVRMRDGGLSVAAPTGWPGLQALLYEGPNPWGLEERGPAVRGPLRLWLGLDRAVDWRLSSFVDIPRRLRPSPLNLLYMDLAGGTAFRPDPDRAILRAIDFDPY